MSDTETAYADCKHADCKQRHAAAWYYASLPAYALATPCPVLTPRISTTRCLVRACAMPCPGTDVVYGTICDGALRPCYAVLTSRMLLPEMMDLSLQPVRSYARASQRPVEMDNVEVDQFTLGEMWRDLPL
eukprot:1998256-Rhodomonas_salina.1